MPKGDAASGPHYFRFRLPAIEQTFLPPGAAVPTNLQRAVLGLSELRGSRAGDYRSFRKRSAPPRPLPVPPGKGGADI
jgi:hypothetical protein